MSANGSENARLAERLSSIAAALMPPVEANGDAASDPVYDVASLAEIAAATDFLERSEGGRHVLTLLRGVIRDHHLDKILESIVENIGSFVLTPLKARIAELEAHIVKIEQQPTMVYRGVWDEETMYSIGDFTTDHGSLWHCDRSCTSVKPGSMEGVWTLAVKHGRDLRK